MTIRSSSSTVTFLQPFTLSGDPREFPAGEYELLVEQEILWGDGFEAHGRTATYMTVPGRGSRAGWKELRAIMDDDLVAARGHDKCSTEDGEAAHSPQEDLK